MSIWFRLNATVVCPKCGEPVETGDLVFHENLTNNLLRMSEAARIDDIIYPSDNSKPKTAAQIIKPIRFAIEDMKSRPEYYDQLEPSNGHGSRVGFLEWLKLLEKACEQYPHSTVFVSR